MNGFHIVHAVYMYTTSSCICCTTLPSCTANAHVTNISFEERRVQFSSTQMIMAVAEHLLWLVYIRGDVNIPSL